MRLLRLHRRTKTARGDPHGTCEGPVRADLLRAEEGDSESAESEEATGGEPADDQQEGGRDNA